MNPIIPESYQDRIDYLIMVLVALAAIVRFWELGTECLWIDEAWSYFVTQQPWHLIPFYDVHPPVFYWFTKAWLTLSGVADEANIRMVSALFGIATIPLVYSLGKRVGNDFVGILAAFMMTFSTFAIYYSQESRQYAITTFFFCIFLLFYLDAIDQKGWKVWAITGGLAAICMYCHWFMFFPIGATVFHAIWYHRKYVANVFIYVSSIFILMMPAIPMLDKAFYTKMVLEGSNLLEGLHGVDIFTRTAYLAGQNNIVIALGLIVLVILGWYLTWSPRKDSISMLIAFVFVVQSIAMILLAEYVVVFPRYFVFLLPLYYVLASIGLIKVVTSITQDRTKIAAVIVVFLAIFGVMVFGYYEPTHKPDMRSTFDPLYPMTNDGDIHMITANQGQFELIKFYYSKWDHTELIRFGSMRDIWDEMQDRPNSTFFIWVPLLMCQMN
jgi:uncharacterized membrane protein